MATAFSSKAEERARAAENHPDIFGPVNLLAMRENVAQILQLIGRDGIFREYTLHDISHIDALLNLVDRLVPEETAETMRPADWLLIVLACYFHDMGMLVTKQEYEDRYKHTEFPEFKKELLGGDKGRDYKTSLDSLSNADREEFLYQEFVRKYHATRIYHWILGQDATRYGAARAAVEAVNSLLSSVEGIVRDDLAKICLSHHEDDLYDLNDRARMRAVSNCFFY